MAAVKQQPGGAVIQAVDAAQTAPTATPPEEDQPDWGATRCLIASTALAGLVGIPLGLLLAWWGMTGQLSGVSWLAWVQAHGQLQIFGWLGLAILGVTFHAMAHLFGTAEASARTASSVLLLQLGGVALRFCAPLVVSGEAALKPWNLSAWVLVASALCLVGAFGITLEAHLRTMPRRGGQRRAPAVLPRYLLVGLVLWLVGLFVNLDGAIDALRFGSRAAGAIDPARDLVVITAAGYGMALVALGMSLRVVVGWLDLPVPDLAAARLAWAPLALGAVLRVAGAALGEPVALEVAGATVWAAGVLFYLPTLRGLWSAGAVAPGGGRRGESDPPLAWFVRTAYAGLLASAALGLLEVWALLLGDLGSLTSPVPAPALADASRHALLFGFLGLLTTGLTGRLPTAFLDLGGRGVMATRAAYRWTWRLILTAAVLRTAGPLAGDARSLLVALSGVLGAAALWCLLWALLRLVALRRLRPIGASSPGAA